MLVRSLEKVLICFFIASFMDEGSAVTGFMIIVVLIFSLSIYVLSIVYKPYDENLYNYTYFILETIKIIIIIGFFIFWILDTADNYNFDYFLLKTYYSWCIVILFGIIFIFLCA